ncbi:hypothetical protein NLG97_g5656 [Lecanicillium saksenae]|uniref:Uncharacterized protein n=1 Tax=Lecanicillium saksenae TaxID=468837 RepID=A0ACC1QTK7_9HYPO|nr:hypothetical protein NLG97_g5656 [Lecanicillium saksenae]
MAARVLLQRRALAAAALGGVALMPATVLAEAPAVDKRKPIYDDFEALPVRVEEPDKNFQYLLVAAEPYETVGFKIPARELDKREDKQFCFWDPDAREFWVQVMFMTEREARFNAAPGLTSR